MNDSQIFDGKEGRTDADYLCWLGEHRSGFVVNIERSRTPRNRVLHGASCGTISEVRLSRGGLPKPGGFTERGYIKICAETVSDARDGLKKHLNDDHVDFSKCCQKCNPA